MTTVGTERVQTPRVDAGTKVTGQAIYTEDLPLPPGTLYGASLRSPYAHARLVSIDAQQALACIEVAYEDLPVLFDTREALKPDAPVIHGKRPGNLVGRFDFGWGDVEQGWRESDYIFEDTYVFQSVFHHPMENLGGCIAEVRGDTLELTAPIQHPFCSDCRHAVVYHVKTGVKSDGTLMAREPVLVWLDAQRDGHFPLPR